MIENHLPFTRRGANGYLTHDSRYTFSAFFSQKQTGERTIHPDPTIRFSRRLINNDLVLRPTALERSALDEKHWYRDA